MAYIINMTMVEENNSSTGATMIKTFENEETGMAACMNNHEDGFSVTLKDLDSGEFVPTVKIFPELETAIEYAKGIE